MCWDTKRGRGGMRRGKKTEKKWKVKSGTPAHFNAVYTSRQTHRLANSCSVSIEKEEEEGTRGKKLEKKRRVDPGNTSPPYRRKDRLDSSAACVSSRYRKRRREKMRRQKGGEGENSGDDNRMERETRKRWKWKRTKRKTRQQMKQEKLEVE